MEKAPIDEKKAFYTQVAQEVAAVLAQHTVEDTEHFMQLYKAALLGVLGTYAFCFRTHSLDDRAKALNIMVDLTASCAKTVGHQLLTHDVPKDANAK